MEKFLNRIVIKKGHKGLFGGKDKSGKIILVDNRYLPLIRESESYYCSLVEKDRFFIATNLKEFERKVCGENICEVYTDILSKKSELTVLPTTVSKKKVLNRNSVEIITLYQSGNITTEDRQVLLNLSNIDDPVKRLEQIICSGHEDAIGVKELQDAIEKITFNRNLQEEVKKIGLVHPVVQFYIEKQKKKYGLPLSSTQIEIDNNIINKLDRETYYFINEMVVNYLKKEQVNFFLNNVQIPHIHNIKTPKDVLISLIKKGYDIMGGEYDPRMPLYGYEEALYRIGDFIFRLPITSVDEDYIEYDSDIELLNGEVVRGEIRDILIDCAQYLSIMGVGGIHKLLGIPRKESVVCTVHIGSVEKINDEKWLSEAHNAIEKKSSELREKHKKEIFNFEDLIIIKYIPEISSSIGTYYEEEEGIGKKDDTVYVSEGSHAIVSLTWHQDIMISDSVNNKIKGAFHI